ncbi:efflux RND transporter periplasmic adaptor subunit [Microbulbifer sp. TYP-18]|uniref:efflux RND transporter periplasmic adaptor subunit n=1 Tax=Microbulbifer sp. TYP-18 TaxID=3230024 RepID=UPI0034C69EF1
MPCRIFVVLPAFTLLLLLVGGCSDQGDKPQQKPPPVEVLAVQEQPVIPRFEFVGRVEATDELEVRARVEGYIENRLFEEGSLVQKGQLLYQIDPAPFEATLDNRNAAQNRAQAALQVSERNYRRGLILVKEGAISQMTMDELTGDYEKAQADLTAAKADVENAELDLSYTRIYSPLTGQIGRSAYTEGALVGPASDPLTSVLKLDPTYVLFEVPQDQLFAVRSEGERRRALGQAPATSDIRIQQPDGNYYPYPGAIAFVDNQIDLNTGSVAVRALFPNPQQLLVQGQFARVSIWVSVGGDDIKPLVPQSAVQEDMQGRYVFVVDDKNIAHRRYLKLGQREGELWAVESGIKVGERVIIAGLQRVVANKPVTPENAPRNPYAERAEQPAPSGRGQRLQPPAEKPPRDVEPDGGSGEDEGTEGK